MDDIGADLVAPFGAFEFAAQFLFFFGFFFLVLSQQF